MSNENETMKEQTMNNETDTLQNDWGKVNNVYGHVSFESNYNNNSPVYDASRYATYAQGRSACEGLKTMFVGYLLLMIFAFLVGVFSAAAVLGLVFIFGLCALGSLIAFYVGYYRVGKSVRKCRTSFWLDIVNTVMGVGVVIFDVIKISSIDRIAMYQLFDEVTTNVSDNVSVEVDPTVNMLLTVNYSYAAVATILGLIATIIFWRALRDEMIMVREESVGTLCMVALGFNAASICLRLLSIVVDLKISSLIEIAAVVLALVGYYKVAGRIEK